MDSELSSGAESPRLLQIVERVRATATAEDGVRILAAMSLEWSQAEQASPAQAGSGSAAHQGASPLPWAVENALLRERLVEKEERLRLALEAASLGTWEHVPSTHATYWDARSKAIFGLAPDDELDFERYRAALHPDDVASVFAGIAKAIDPKGSGACSLQYRIRRLDGVECWVEAHGRCAFVNGVAQRINGTLLDITERRRAEQAVREVTRRKDEFLALLGHELRNPLAPILTALELMRSRHPTTAMREREVIERQVRHMMRLVDDLLDLARIARGSISLRRESIGVASAVERAIEMASPLFEARQHHLSVDLARGLLVDVDPVRFLQVVSNLLTNAAKFTPPGGNIEVRGFARGEEVFLEVEDDGIGIEPAQLSTIFEPFVQAAPKTDETHGGLGLGLSLARDLIQLHGGSVEVESAGAGLGSCFRLRLPSGSSALPARPTALEPRAATPVPRRVLVVDDNEDSADMLGLLLSELGHVVRVAYDGPQALAIAAELEPDIAVLDIGLPVMDGYELAARLREGSRAGSLRLVALTGFGQDRDRARVREAGFHRHLVKPVDAQELAAALVD